MFSSFKYKIIQFASSKTLQVALLFLFVFVITSLVEVITNFYEVKTPIVHGYFMWIMLFLFMCVILPAKESQLTTTLPDNLETPPLRSERQNVEGMAVGQGNGVEGGREVGQGGVEGIAVGLGQGGMDEDDEAGSGGGGNQQGGGQNTEGNNKGPMSFFI